MKPLRYGKAVYHFEDFNPRRPCCPSPVFSFSTVYAQGEFHSPQITDRTMLKLLRRDTEKRISLARAYEGWLMGGSPEERELGESRAFYRWLMRYDLSILWHKRDFAPHPYFEHSSTAHHPQDEFAQGMSFAIAPVEVGERKIKMYLEDDDVIRLLSLKDGAPTDFMELMRAYVLKRLAWRERQTQALSFADWVILEGCRPLFSQGQIGLSLPVHFHYKKKNAA